MSMATLFLESRELNMVINLIKSLSKINVKTMKATTLFRSILLDHCLQTKMLYTAINIICKIRTGFNLWLLGLSLLITNYCDRHWSVVRRSSTCFLKHLHVPLCNCLQDSYTILPKWFLGLLLQLSWQMK